MRTFFAFAMLVACFAAWGQAQSVTAPRLLRAQELLAPVDQAALDRQYFALRRMTLEAVEYSPRGPISSVVGQTGIVLPANISGRAKGDSATDLLPLIKDLLLASGGESLSVEENSRMYGTGTSLRLSQSIRGIPVVNGVVSMTYDADTKQISALVAHFVPDRNLPRAPKLSAEEARDILRQAVEKAEGTKADISEGAYLAYFAGFNDPSPPQLVWAIRATTAESDHMYFVDAATGLVTSRSSMRIRLTRKVYDANNNFLPKLPQGLPTQSLDATQIAAQLYRSTPNNYVQNADDILRLKIPNSIPQFPSTVNIVVRNGQSSGGSYHTRAGTQDYISLPGSLSGSHTHAGLVDDIVVHEFAHAIGVRTFPYAGDDSREWAALHESYSDAAATVVDIAKHGGPSDLTWIIADGFFTDGDGLRSMKNPFNELSVRDFGNDWYPNYIFGPEWEHVNSGIISHAYYLMVNGGQHARWTDAQVPDTNITALGEPTARNIFFNAFRNISLDVNPDFPKLKGAAMAQAEAMYGQSARTQVKNAFETVGICKTATVAPPAPTLQTIGDLLCAGRFNPIWNLIVGATRYYAEVAPATLGFAFAQPVTDVSGETNHCLFRVSQPSLYRMRACNDCGCGPWSETWYLPYWSPCL